MSRALEQSYANGIKPYLDGQLAGEVAMEPHRAAAEEVHARADAGIGPAAVHEALRQVQFAGPDDVPLSVLMPTFITSELKTAFQIGFMVFIPFLVIDLVVASVLMSMGMMMLSPVLVSLPFKLCCSWWSTAGPC